MKEKIEKPCLQEQTGSCGGCRVIEDIARRVKAALQLGEGLDLQNLVILPATPDEWLADRCPDGYKPQGSVLAAKMGGEIVPETGIL